MSYPTRTDEYTMKPDRNADGAAKLLKAIIAEGIQCTSLTAILTGHHHGAQPDQETLALLQLRLREAQILAARL